MKWRRVAAGAIVSLGLLLGATAAAHATVNVYDDSEAATLLGQVRKAKCKLKHDKDGKYFVARGESPSGDLALSVNIRDWQGFKEHYEFYLGVNDPNFFVTAANGVFSNVYEIPSTPPGAVSAGGAEFRSGGKKVRFGVYLAPDSDLMGGVKFAGGMKCKYPKGEAP